MRPISDYIVKLLANLSPPMQGTGCIEWMGGRTSAGYGGVWLNGESMYAHRLAFIGAGNHIPKGMCVCHRCDNPACCNPYHLFAGTKLDNNRDCLAKGRMPNRDVPKGEKQHLAKLTKDDVLEIRSRPWENQYDLAKEFGVSQHTIWAVLRNRTWKHI